MKQTDNILLSLEELLKTGEFIIQRDGLETVQMYETREAYATKVIQYMDEGILFESPELFDLRQEMKTFELTKKLEEETQAEINVRTNVDEKLILTSLVVMTYWNSETLPKQLVKICNEIIKVAIKQRNLVAHMNSILASDISRNAKRLALQRCKKENIGLLRTFPIDTIAPKAFSTRKCDHFPYHYTIETSLSNPKKRERKNNHNEL